MAFLKLVQVARVDAPEPLLRAVLDLAGGEPQDLLPAREKRMASVATSQSHSPSRAPAWTTARRAEASWASAGSGVRGGTAKGSGGSCGG